MRVRKEFLTPAPGIDRILGSGGNQGVGTYYRPDPQRQSIQVVYLGVCGELAGVVDTYSGESVIKVISIILADDTVVLHTQPHVADVMPGGRVRWKH